MANYDKQEYSTKLFTGYSGFTKTVNGVVIKLNVNGFNSMKGFPKLIVFGGGISCLQKSNPKFCINEIFK